MSLSDSFFPSDNFNQRQLLAAASILRRGGVVAFPTESSYGLAVDIGHDAALHRLYRLKCRAADKAFPVLIGSRADLDRLVAYIPLQYQALIETFWPGALTLVFPSRPELSPVLTCGAATIAIRHSSHPVACGLAASAGPITATSANRAGESPCTTAKEVIATFGDTVDMVIDGGRADAAPSTIVRLANGQKELEVLREGQLPAALFCG